MSFTGVSTVTYLGMNTWAEVWLCNSCPLGVFRGSALICCGYTIIVNGCTQQVVQKHLQHVAHYSERDTHHHSEGVWIYTGWVHHRRTLLNTRGHHRTGACCCLSSAHSTGRRVVWRCRRRMLNTLLCSLLTSSFTTCFRLLWAWASKSSVFLTGSNNRPQD